MRTALLAGVLIVASLTAAGAQSPSPSPVPSASPGATAAPSELARTRVDAMLRTGHADPAWFSASFLAQVPASKIDEIVAQLTAALGKYQSTDGANGTYTAHFEKGADLVLVHLDAANKIDGLFFRPPVLAAKSFDDAVRGLTAAAPPGATISYVIREGRSERAALNASQPLAVGSAFKLAALAAVRDQIAHGKRRWTDVVRLEARSKSLPSGVLQGWPNGTPITIGTYAAEMISISDNTAADTMVRLADDATLIPYAKRNVPFLTTREMFTLKSTEGAALRTAYLAAKTAPERRVILRKVDALPLPPIDSLVETPILAIEWHYTVRELCDLMNHDADLPVMSINPGPAEAKLFRHVAYKGGSDVGILNLTTQVTTKRGTTYCVSATINDPAHAVAEMTLLAAYKGILGFLAER
ncbi:MAG TPA: serine hydrolase [Candidatus Elarobacter sp.]